MKKFLAGLSAVAVLAAGGVAMVGLSTDTANAQEDTTVTEEAPGVDEQRPHKHARGRIALGIAAETIGIEPSVLAEALAGGSTVSEVAEANGSSGQAVVDAIVATASERIDAAVEDGRLTAEEGAQRLASITERVTEMVDNVIEIPHGHHHRGRGLKAAAEVIGIRADELLAELQDGSSVADVAEANGSSGQEVIDALVANVSERIDAAVADGKLTADEGAEMLSRATERITQRVNTVPDFDGRGPRGPRGPGGPFGPPQGDDANDA